MYQNIKQYPAIAEEVAKIEEALEKYAQAHKKTLPSDMLNSIMEAIDEADKAADKTTDTASEETTQKTKPIEKQLPSSTENTLLASLKKYRFWAAAASILLALSVLLNIYHYQQLNSTRSKLTALENEKLQFAKEMDVIKAKYDESVTNLDILKNPNNVVIKMEGAKDDNKDALATVYWNADNQKVHLYVNNLPKPPADKQYQLWALKDGKPIDAGVFEHNNTLQALKTISAADAFAVTLEPPRRTTRTDFGTTASDREVVILISTYPKLKGTFLGE